MAEKISCFPSSERHGKTIFSFVQYMFEYSVLTAPIVANFFSNKWCWIVLEPNSSVISSKVQHNQYRCRACTGSSSLISGYFSALWTLGVIWLPWLPGLVGQNILDDLRYVGWWGRILLGGKCFHFLPNKVLQTLLPAFSPCLGKCSR